MSYTRDIAIFLMQNDPQLLSEEIVNRNGHDMYEGNFRLNKYMHIANNVYIAKTGKALFPDSLYAYDNGGVLLDIVSSFIPLKKSMDRDVDLSDDVKSFLKQMVNALKNASIDELMEISHQDKEWQERNRTGNQRMDSLSKVEEYREQYNDILKMMGLGLC